MRAPDAKFADARLASVYDPLDPDRSDLDAYLDLLAEVGARRVLDIGCGTGELACRLARQGHDVLGVDPAAGSLDVARRKPGADRVRWVHGVVPDLLHQDLEPFEAAVMTANVAQVFVEDDEWVATLHGVRRLLADDGLLVFETRDPTARAWEEWTPERSRVRADVSHLPGETWVESVCEVTDVDRPEAGGTVSFRHTFTFGSDGPDRPDGPALTSDSTLRFRSIADLSATLSRAGLSMTEVRDAPDRPGREWVVLCRAE